ncbi:hypothetical protein YC2023_081812 [Brassica napus]
MPRSSSLSYLYCNCLGWLVHIIGSGKGEYRRSRFFDKGCIPFNIFNPNVPNNHHCQTQIYGTLHLPLRGYTVLRFLRGLRGFAVEDRDGDRLGREDEYDVVTSSYKFAESGYKCGERIFGSFAGSGEDLRESCRRCAGSERIRGDVPVVRGFAECRR